MIEDKLFFDIETLPTTDEALIADIASRVTPPATMKKAETIQKWIDEEKPAAIAEAVAKTSLDGGYGRIASIAWAVGDGEIEGYTSAHRGEWNPTTEQGLLITFFKAAEALERATGGAILVGHNIQGFDIRWLWKRAVILGIETPDFWPVDARPWERDRMVDTMLLWEGHGGRISQDRLARCLGLAGKGDVDGSKVADLWAAGRFEDVLDYNRDDVRTVREIWKRITGWTPARSIDMTPAPDDDGYSDDLADLTTRTIETAVPVQTVSDVPPTSLMALHACDCGKAYFAPEPREACPKCAAAADVKEADADLYDHAATPAVYGCDCRHCGTPLTFVMKHQAFDPEGREDEFPIACTNAACDPRNETQADRIWPDDRRYRKALKKAAA